MVEKEMLIVRSVSFQQIDQSLPKIQEAFSHHRITLLTHQHGAKLAEKYKSIHMIYTYPFKKGFRFDRKVNEIRSKKFDAVIIPVSNLSGTGFFNVLLFSLTISANQRYVCNMISEIREITTAQIFGIGVRHIIFIFISAILAAVFGLLALLLLPLGLKRLLKGR